MNNPASRRRPVGVRGCGLLVLAAAVAAPTAAQDDDLFTADRVPRLHIRLSDRDAKSGRPAKRKPTSSA